MFNIEQASYGDAKKLCDSRQMDLLSIQTPAESDLISGFLNSKGMLLVFFNVILKLFDKNRPRV